MDQTILNVYKFVLMKRSDITLGCAERLQAGIDVLEPYVIVGQKLGRLVRNVLNFPALPP